MRNRNFILNILFFVILISVILYRAVDRIWITEDAFISFKHIDNYFAGNGLSFNKWNRLECFTHPLWVFLILLVKFFTSLAHFQIAVVLGILFCVLSQAVLFYYFMKKYTMQKLHLFLLPSIYAMHLGFIDFTTSGLENSLTYFLLVLFYIQVLDRKKFFSPGISAVLGLLYLVRPEFILFAVYYSFIYVLSALKNRLGIRAFILFFIPLAFFVGGYHIFRYFYYNDIFPMSYYAKAGGEVNISDGIFYLQHTLKYTPYLGILLVSFAVLYIRSSVSEKTFDWILFRDIVGIFIAGGYVIKMGGDFMAFRLLLPSVFMFLLLFEDRLHEEWSFSEKTVLGLNVLLILSVVYYSSYKGEPNTGNEWLNAFLKRNLPRTEVPFVKGTVADERKAYYGELNQDLKSRFSEIKYKWYTEGTKYRKLQECLNFEPMIISNSLTRAKCADGFGLGYFAVAAGPNVDVADELGFTHKNVLPRTKEEEPRPGHLKVMELDEVVRTGSMFCSLDDKRYDSIFKTKYGIIIRPELKILASFGSEEYRKKVRKLKRLYSEVSKSRKKEDILLFQRLQLIEKTDRFSILSLPDRISSEKKNCWD